MQTFTYFYTLIPTSLLSNRASLAYADKDMSIINALNLTRHADYSNPHDRIFALLGLMKPEEVVQILADYNLPIYEVFRNIALVLKRYVNLRFLANCDLSTHGKDPSFPSWVPDWSTWRPFDTLIMSQFTSGSSETRVDGLHGSQLHIDGVRAGVVEVVSDEAPLQGDIMGTLQLWEQSMMGNDDRRRPEFIKALTCGRYEEAWPEYLYPTFQTYWDSYFGESGGTSCSDVIRGRSMFRYGEEGWLGICPSGTRKGNYYRLIVQKGNCFLLMFRF